MADGVDPRVAAARAKAEQARNRQESPEERERRLAELKKQAQAKKAQLQAAKGGGAEAPGEEAAGVPAEPRGWKKAAHDQAVKDIAATRLPFPNQEHPELKTYVNRPRVQMVVETPTGKKLIPDLVVMEWRIHRPVMIGEVETAESLASDDVLEKWRSFAELDDVSFYLYVPLQQAFEVRDLLRKHKIEVAGLRAWRYIHGFNSALDITEIELRVPFWAALFHA